MTSWNGLFYWARKMHLNMCHNWSKFMCTTQWNNCIQNFKWFVTKKKEKIIKQTNTKLLCACVKWWRCVFKCLTWQLRKYGSGFFCIFCGCLATSMSLSPSGVYTIFGVARFMKININICMVYTTFWSNVIWLQRTISLSTMAWLLIETHQFIHAHVQCWRPNKTMRLIGACKINRKCKKKTEEEKYT